MMKKTIVFYYSKTGSNKFLAYKIKHEIDAEIEEIKPRINSHILLMLGFSLGIKKLKNNISDFDRVILCGPVWMGKFIEPLKAFSIKHKNQIKELIFVTCCGSSYEIKEKKFGHGRVFKKVESLFAEKCTHCEALPIALLLPDNKKQDADLVMYTRLTESNFNGEFLEHFKLFISNISG
jgi:flavodoxin